ncbi:YkvA family protein [Pseudothermotoga sp. U03pept]|uniref:YkvA family protein n=1 Tax=Pseudothermotoga sp. U03pept TaxID=3447012 RepID=UPI003F071583
MKLIKVKDLNRTIAALYLARKDKRVPKKSKILISVAIGYVLSPIDLIPDFIPIIGQLDDLIIVPALIALAIKSMPKDVLEHYRLKAEQINLKKSFGIITLFITFFWSLVAIWLIKFIMKLL